MYGFLPRALGAALMHMKCNPDKDNDLLVRLERSFDFVRLFFKGLDSTPAGRHARDAVKACSEDQVMAVLQCPFIPCRSSSCPFVLPALPNCTNARGVRVLPRTDRALTSPTVIAHDPLFTMTTFGLMGVCSLWPRLGFSTLLSTALPPVAPSLSRRW